MKIAYFLLLVAVFSSCKKPYNETFSEVERLAEHKSFLEAVELLSELIEDYPNDEKLLLKRGIYQSHIGDCFGANLDYSEVLKLNQLNDLARYNRAACYYELEDYNSAYRDLERLLLIRGKGGVQLTSEHYIITDNQLSNLTTEEIVFLHGVVCVELEMVGQAIADFKFCIKNQYNLSESHYWYGFLLVGLNQLDEACVQLKMAQDLGDLDAKELLDNYCN